MIASAIISGLGTAASGLMSYFNNKKAQQQADAEYARQQAYAEARAAENPLARSENQAVINEYDRKAKQQVETARNRNVITGGTPEMDLATQQAVADGRASLLSGIGAQASARADKYRDAAEASRQNKFAADQARAEARNQTYAALASNAASALSGLYAGGESATGDTEMADAVQRAKLEAADRRAKGVSQVAANSMIGKGADGTANGNPNLMAAMQQKVAAASAPTKMPTQAQAEHAFMQQFDADGNPILKPNQRGLTGNLLQTTT